MEVVTDSEYLKNGITTWIHELEAPRLDDQARRSRWSTRTCGRSWTTGRRQTKITWAWTKGHASHADNNRCDELAQTAAREQRRSTG